MKKSAFVLIVFAFYLFACTSGIDAGKYTEIQKKGNEISGLAQSTLLMNVGKAIQQGGPENAVEFCNLNASSIIDELNTSNSCTISRISNKNRNPKNSVQGEKDKILWEIFQRGNLADTIVKNKSKLVYYKPIKIALPACLKCHGIPEKDLNRATKEKLEKLYPEDLATGYQLNDFRGLWKIEFNY